ncbi:DUF742 domain-containing protein [Streptomyces sp. NPDC093108]|uniref:DUF742 domain-containing protein n=1 Tax=Streptomyces sp. NPDC093108 TaxID=3366030 RepID=UPI0037F636AC
METGEVWLRSASAEVRPYALTGGRTVPAHPLTLDSVLAVPTAPHPQTVLGLEATMALQLCAEEARTVAEIVGVLGMQGVPVQVVKVLLSDLIDTGCLELAERAEAGTVAHLLGRVLHGLRTKWPEARAHGSGGDSAAA